MMRNMRATKAWRLLASPSRRGSRRRSDQGRRCLAHPFQNHVGEGWFVADAGGVPDSFAAFFGRVTPGGLAALVALLDHPRRGAQHHGDLFVGVQPVADKERDDDKVL